MTDSSSTATNPSPAGASPDAPWRLEEGMLRVRHIAWAIWFYYGITIATTAVLFQGNPRLGTAVKAAMTVVIFAVLVVLALSRAVQLTRLRSDVTVTAIMALVIWAGVSILWTEAVAPAVTAAFWITRLVDLMTIWLLVRMGDLPGIARSSMQGYVAGSLSAAALAVLLGMRDSLGRLGDEAFMHPNQLGFSLAVAGLVSMYLVTDSERPSSSVIWSAAAVASTIGLVAALSKTALGAYLVAAVIMFAIGRFGFEKRIVALLAAVMVIGLSAGAVVEGWDRYVNSVDGQKNLRTLTGRTEIWEATRPYIEAAPIIGHGMMSFRDTGPQIVEVRLVHAHNEAVQILFVFGAVGLVLALLIYLLFARQMFTTRRRRRGPWSAHTALGISILVFSLLRGVTEADDELIILPLKFILLLSAWSSYAMQYGTTAIRSEDADA